MNGSKFKLIDKGKGKLDTDTQAKGAVGCILTAWFVYFLLIIAFLIVVIWGIITVVGNYNG